RESLRFGFSQRAAFNPVGERRGVGLLLGLLDKDRAPRGIPGRNLMPPPELARNAPRLDVLEPVEVGLLPALRHELSLAPADRVNRRTSQRLGVDIPLIGEPGLD